jgi:serine/threonine protein kinase
VEVWLKTIVQRYPDMNTDRWLDLQQIFHGTLSRAPGEREAFLDQACRGDDELRREVVSLLAKAESDTSAIGKPVQGLAADFLTADTNRSLAGRNIANYRLLSLIGTGGMGEVYQALDVRLNRHVAIKVLPKAFAEDPERLARFRREAQLLASLNHPNIAAVYGLEESDGILSLVMEFVPGETLAERLEKARLDIDDALRISAQIAEALEAAHDKGIIHRDLKPANIKITPEGKVKVLDFGLAKVFERDTAAAPTLTEARTEDGWILGTPAYMSPEQARGKSLDERTDIWSFGCVLYEMLASQRAFRGDTSAETISKVLEREPEWQLLGQTTPAGIKSLLRRCLQKDTQRRLRHIGDARIEIEETLHAAPVVEAPTNVKSAGGRRRPGLLYLS